MNKNFTDKTSATYGNTENITLYTNNLHDYLLLEDLEDLLSLPLDFSDSRASRFFKYSSRICFRRSSRFFYKDKPIASTSAIPKMEF